MFYAPFFAGGHIRNNYCILRRMKSNPHYTMCFYISQHLQAETIARRYGRHTRRVESARRKLAALEREARSATDDRTSPYAYRLGEGMYVIPAQADPYALIISSDLQLEVMRWGLTPHSATTSEKARYDKEHLYKEVPAEQLFTAWPWRKLWQHRRCLLPVTGFFEPHYDEYGMARPYYIQRIGGIPFCIAALYDEWRHPTTNEPLRSFATITVAANPLLREIHNGGSHPFRMPLIIPDGYIEQWLAPGTDRQEEVEPYLIPYSAHDLEAWPVEKSFDSDNPYAPSGIARAETHDPMPALLF